MLVCLSADSIGAEQPRQYFLGLLSAMHNQELYTHTHTHTHTFARIPTGNKYTLILHTRLITLHTPRVYLLPENVTWLCSFSKRSSYVSKQDFSQTPGTCRQFPTCALAFWHRANDIAIKSQSGLIIEWYRMQFSSSSTRVDWFRYRTLW